MGDEGFRRACEAYVNARKKGCSALNELMAAMRYVDICYAEADAKSWRMIAEAAHGKGKGFEMETFHRSNPFMRGAYVYDER